MARVIAVSKEQAKAIQAFWSKATNKVDSMIDQMVQSDYEGKHSTDASVQTRLDTVLNKSESSISNADVIRSLDGKIDGTNDVSSFVGIDENVNIKPGVSDTVYDTVTNPIEGTPDLMKVVERKDVENSMPNKYDGLDVEGLLAELSKVKSRLFELRNQNNELDNKFENILSMSMLNLKYDRNYDFTKDDAELEKIKTNQELNSSVIEVLENDLRVISMKLAQKCQLAAKNNTGKTLDVPLEDTKPTFEMQKEVAFPFDGAVNESANNNLNANLVPPEGEAIVNEEPVNNQVKAF